MSSKIYMFDPRVPQSESRKLDERVSMEEMPYGYTNSPPPSDTGDYDQKKLESNKQYSIRQGKIT